MRKLIFLFLFLFSSVCYAGSEDEARRYALRALYAQTGWENQVNNYIASQIKKIEYYEMFQQFFAIYNIVYEQKITVVYEF